jgi:hypothetical protein
LSPQYAYLEIAPREDALRFASPPADWVYLASISHMIYHATEQAAKQATFVLYAQWKNPNTIHVGI